MSQAIYYQRTDGIRALCAGATGNATPMPELTLFAPVDWLIYFRDGAELLPDVTGITGALILKPSADYEGEARVILDMAEDVDGAVSLTADSLDSEELRADLEGKPEQIYWAQLKWTLEGEAEARSRPFAVRVYNSPYRPTEEAPSPGSNAAWVALKARVLAGANMTRTVDDEAETMTFASTAAYSGPELRLTGQILEVNVGGLWRQIATLPAGSIG